MPSWLSMGFQDSNSPLLTEFVTLHDHIMVIMILIILLVSYIICLLVFSSSVYDKFLAEGTFIEIIWSLIPTFLLFFLVVPSMKVLYFMEDTWFPDFSVKVVGHQWYWSYSTPLSKSGSSYSSYDSVMSQKYPRLLSCSSELVVPVNSKYRLLISSSDVIHSFSVPSLGLKMDAVPGRINQIYGSSSRLGNYFGQCSEICGSYHTFMPIVVKVVDYRSYNNTLFVNTLDGYLDKTSI